MKKIQEALKKERGNVVIGIQISEKSKIVEYLLIAWLPLLCGRGFDAEWGRCEIHIKLWLTTARREKG